MGKLGATSDLQSGTASISRVCDHRWIEFMLGRLSAYIHYTVFLGLVKVSLELLTCIATQETINS